MNLLLYLSKTLVVSGLLYAYYWLFLRNKQFHQYNRFYLLSIPVISWFLPLFHIPIPGQGPGHAIKLLRVIAGDWEEAVVITGRQSGFEKMAFLEYAVWAVYLIILVLLSYFFLRSVSYVIRLSRKYPYEKLGDIRFFQTPEPGTPFSFLKNIFWNQQIDAHTIQGGQVLRHELYHVRKHHTADILFVEMSGILCWFNPFFHLLKKEIKVIHEFLADQYAASGSNRYDYAELLVTQSIRHRHLTLANPFFHNQIKRRITMITSFKNTRYGYISRLMALPLLFILFCAFAVKLNSHNATGLAYANKPITVVIDAGHGGIDPGTISAAGVLEKNLNLSIAKKIRALSKNYNVNVIMTRNEDILPGNATTIDKGLTNRMDMATNNNADLFISIHIDAEAGRSGIQNGFSIYLSSVNPFYQKSLQLGSALTEEIKKTYAINPDLKEREHKIKVLEGTVPAVMIQCGYITNKKDLAFISDEANQEKIANDILNGIVKYANGVPVVQQGIVLQKDTVVPKEIKIAGQTPYTKVEIESEYPGGFSGWSAYLQKNLKYPKKAVAKEIQGTVLAQFIVNTDGSLADIKVLTSPDKSLTDETLRIIKNSGKWLPAQQDGKKVRAYKKQPIIFKLQEK